MHTQQNFLYKIEMSQDFRDAIRHGLAEKGYTMKKAAQLAGLSDTYVRDILKRNRTPTVDKFAKLADVLGINPEVILNRPDDQNDTPKSSRTTDNHNFNHGKINRELLRKIVSAIEETRRTRNIGIGGKTSVSYADFVTDVYNLCIEAGGSFEAVQHFFQIDPLAENGKPESDD